jgi:hypothetical protein
MNNPGLNIKDQKRRGEWAEMRFLARVSELGMTVTRPWGDSLHYDMVVESEGGWLRVQVKSSTCKRNNSYFINLHGSNHYYTKDDFDFIAAYIIPINLWYIIPAEAALRGRDKLCMTPDSPETRYAPYQEAWHLLSEKCRRQDSISKLTTCHPEAAESPASWVTPNEGSMHSAGGIATASKSIDPSSRKMRSSG